MNIMAAASNANLLIATLVLLAAILDRGSCEVDENIIDLSHKYSNTAMVTWPMLLKFNISVGFKGLTPGGVYYEEKRFCTSEHSGTHVDAPLHFYEHAQSVDKIPLKTLIGPGAVIDVSGKTDDDPSYEVTVQDILDWEADNGRIPDGAVLLLNTGWHRRWPNDVEYLGTKADVNNPFNPDYRWPGLAGKTAQWLADSRSIGVYGVDCVSIDYSGSSTFPVHKIFLSPEHGIPSLENVANLDAMPPTGTRVYAIPMYIRDGTGAPTRLFAVVNGGQRHLPAFGLVAVIVLLARRCLL
ncbi:PREDICTED: kynurenine formamidase-like [Priapulus caudatus]|uniref:Kynurenine formamidase-like n=1 Tax=Priapulus caudatus TaxID=37621 RepID=A0ABM1FB03_PRICU|nr:PREDICTED: kynurenine formamidase-like [Priapulus caudatus]